MKSGHEEEDFESFLVRHDWEDIGFLNQLAGVRI